MALYQTILFTNLTVLYLCLNLPGPAEPRSPTGREADRDQYRRGGPMEGKPAPGAGSDFKPEFVSRFYAPRFAFLQKVSVKI